MCSVRNQPSAANPGSRSPSIGESGARCRAISARVIDPPPGRSRWTTTPSTMSSSSGLAWSSEAATSSALARTLSAAACVALPVMTEAREAWAPMPYGMRSVCPDHPHPAVVEPQRIGADLRHRGGETLADRRTASHQLDRAGGIDGDPGAVHWSKPAFLDEDRDSAPDQFAGSAAAAQLRLQRFPADLRECLIQQSRIVAGIVDDLPAQRAK